jgi:hypothetical protein
MDEFGDAPEEETSEIEELLNQMVESDDWDHENILGMESRDLIMLLDFLCDEAMSSWVIRKAIDKRVDRLEDIESSRTRIRLEHAKTRTVCLFFVLRIAFVNLLFQASIEETHNVTISAALCLNDIVNQVSNDGKWFSPSLEEDTIEKLRIQKIEASLEFMKYVWLFFCFSFLILT